MTSTNVTKISANVSFQTSAASKAEKQEQEAADFMGMLGNLTAGYQNISNPQTDMTVSESHNESKVEFEKYSAKEDRIPEASDKMDEAQMKEAQEAVEEFAGEVQKKVEETFGVSKEQLEAAMEKLGLTYADLMNPTNLANLVMELTGENDSLGLLMNADFQELMQNVEGLTKNLLQQLGMTEQEAADLLNELQQLQQLEQLENSGVSADETVQSVQTEGVTDVETQSVMTEVSENADVENTDVIEAEVVQKETKTVDVQEETTVQNETVEKNVESTQNEASDDMSGNADTQSSDENEMWFQQNNGMAEARSFEEGMTQNIQNNVKAVDTAVVNPANTMQNTAVNVADIIRQVSEFTRVMYQGDITSMEMQLNPENLGKIFVQVSSKEGVITAQLAAQNETVKEALENQIVQLKENMNQQGIKVEAVEVTIASHEFERNLEENQHNQSEEEQKEQASKNSRRNISMNELDELSGLMSEEEALVAKIMRDNGNSVDFTA